MGTVGLMVVIMAVNRIQIKSRLSMSAFHKHSRTKARCEQALEAVALASRKDRIGYGQPTAAGAVD
jgi:hypothetical protein